MVFVVQADIIGEEVKRAVVGVSFGGENIGGLGWVGGHFGGEVVFEDVLWGIS